MNTSRKKIISFSLFIILGAAFTYLAFIPSLKKVNTDFPNYYVSSNMYLDGKDMKTAYDNVQFTRQLLMYGINDQLVSYTPYPPLTALLMTPIAKLPPLDAKFAWNIFNLILLLGCILILSKISNINFFAVGIIFFLSGFALMNNFMFAQTYLLVLFFLCLAMYFMSKGKDILSALFISLSIVLKFYTIFFIFLFIFKKRYKLLVYTIVFSALIYIPVILLTGFDLNWFYFTKIMPQLGDGWVGTVYAAEYQSFLSLLHRWFDYEPSLNPNPVFRSTVLFYILKYAYIFFILTLSISFIKPATENFKPVIENIKPVIENIKLELSLFCIVCLLLLPVNASYQFVVLIPAVVFIAKYYWDNKNYLMAGTVISVMLLMNSPAQVFITSKLKDTPLYILAYVKLIGLLFLWIINLKILGKLNSLKLFNQRTNRFLAIGAVHIVFLTILSYSLNKPINDGDEYIKTSNNYLISMPSAYNDKLVWTECAGEKFVLRSNFGFSYDKENVFYPVLIDSEHIAFETIENKLPKQKVIDIKTGIQRDASGIKLNSGSFTKDKKLECYSQNGVIFIKETVTGIAHPVTSGKQMCFFPVFADNDNSIIFASDRNRGVGFTALYKIKVPLVKGDLGGLEIPPTKFISFFRGSFH